MLRNPEQQHPTVNYKGKELTVWELDDLIKWERLMLKTKKVKEDLKLKPKLTSYQYKTYVALLILGYNFEGGNMDLVFKKTKKDPNNIVSDDYFLFAQRTIDYSEIKIDILKKLHDIVKDDELLEEFKVDGNLLKEEKIPWHKIDSSNIAYGLT